MALTSMTSASTPRSRSRSSTSGSSDTTMNSPPATPVRPRPSSHGLAAAEPESPPTDATFNLLALPRELRNQIYTFALVSPFPFWVPAPSSPKHNVALSLLRVNRQVHDEAAPILYSHNKFLFTHPSDCNIFRVHSSAHSEQITSVCIRMREKDVKLWTKYLGSKQLERSLQADLPKLKHLCINLRCWTGMIGQIPQPGAGAGGGGHVPVGLVAQVQAMQHALGGQMTALQQQVQNQIQALQQQVHMAMGQANVFANAPPAPAPFAPFANAGQAQAQPQPPFPPQPHPHGQVNNPPPNPSPLAQHLASALNGQPPAPRPHPLFASFLRFEREMGLESLCLTLAESRPADADVKIVCIVKMAREELQRLLMVYKDELTADRNGDARTRFVRVRGVEVCLEICGFEVGG